MIRLIALLLLVASTALAQSGDIKLSVDREQIILPTDAQIQSAAVVGDTTLVVWGSTRRIEGEVRNVLWMQSFVGAVATGEARIISADAARPYAFVQAVAAGPRFFIVWNDRRANVAGAYILRVETSGEIGEEERLSDPIATPGLLVVPVVHGHLLIWSNTSSADPMLRTRSVDIDGTVAREERLLGPGRPMARLVPTSDPSINILERGDHPPLVIDSIGDLVSFSPEAVKKFSMPYYLDIDGSVVATANDTIRLFRSLLDSVPERTVLLPFKRGMTVPSRDSIGRIVVNWVEPVVEEWGPYTQEYFKWMAITETSPSSFSEERLENALLINLLSSCDDSRLWVERSRAVRGCNNQYMLVFDLYHEVTRVKCGPHYDSMYSQRFTKRFVVGNNYVIRPMFPDPAIMSVSCAPIPSSTVARLLGRRSSDVEVKISDSFLVLSAPTATEIVNVVERVPALQSIDGEMMIAAMHDGIDSSALLGAWNHHQRPAVTWRDEVATYRGTSAPRRTSAVEEMDSLKSEDGFFYLASYARWDEPTPNTTTTHDSEMCDVYVPTRFGWNHAFARQQTRLWTLKVLSAARDPQFGNTLFVLGGVTKQGTLVALRAISINGNGDTLWSVDTLQLDRQPSGLSVIPTGAGGYLLFGPSTMFAMEGALKRVSVPLALQPGISRYLQRSDRRIARWSLDGTRIVITLLDTSGQLIDSLPASTLPTGALDPIMISRSDSRQFALVVGGVSGVRAMIFDDRFRLQKTIDVSTTRDPVRHPTAAFLGDTLYVAWEDYRNGVSDIYGAIVTPEQMKVGVEENGVADAVDAIAIVPTPSRDHAIITLPSSIRGEATIEIVDNLGARRVLVTTRDREVVVDTSTLPAGMYLVRVRGGGAVPMVVVR